MRSQRVRHSRTTPVVSLIVIAAFVASSCGYSAPGGSQAQTKSGALSTDGLHGFMITAGGSPTVAVNAYGGATDGGPLKLYQGCTWDNPDCTWTYRNGLILSDRNPSIGIRTSDTPTDGELLTQSARCGVAAPLPPASCFWIYRAGHFISVKNQNFAIYASDGAVHGGNLKLNKNCPNGKSVNCHWVIQSAMIGDVASQDGLMYNAWGGATEGTVVRLADACSRDNPDCTWTFMNGMILSDRDPTLALNAWGGAVVGAPLVLTGYCDESNPSCRWRLDRGVLYSDVSNLAINPSAQDNGADMALANGCSSSNCRVDIPIGGPQCGQLNQGMCNDGSCAAGLTPMGGVCVPIQVRTVRCPDSGSLIAGSVDASISVSISNTGSWSMSGHAHNSGFWGMNYTLGFTFDEVDDGEQFGEVRSGELSGTLDGATKTEDWVIGGQDVTILASDSNGGFLWDSVFSQSPVHCNLHASGNPWLVAQDAIVGLGLVATGVAVVALLVLSGGSGNDCQLHSDPNDPDYGKYKCEMN